VLTGRLLFERSGHVLVMQDAGDLGEDEEDVMAAPREAEPNNEGVRGDADDEAGADADDTDMAVSDALLAEVGDASLFNDSELLDED